jgi:hypothetical protein
MQHAYEFFGSEHCHRLFQKSQNLVSKQQAHFPLLQYIIARCFSLAQPILSF